MTRTGSTSGSSSSSRQRRGVRAHRHPGDLHDLRRFLGRIRAHFHVLDPLPPVLFQEEPVRLLLRVTAKGIADGGPQREIRLLLRDPRTETRSLGLGDDADFDDGEPLVRHPRADGDDDRAGVALVRALRSIALLAADRSFEDLVGPGIVRVQRRRVRGVRGQAEHLPDRALERGLLPLLDPLLGHHEGPRDTEHRDGADDGELSAVLEVPGLHFSSPSPNVLGRVWRSISGTAVFMRMIE
jgi:hypothetical protein